MRLMSTPRSVEVAITGKCNLRCLYCSHFSSGSDSGKDLPAEDWGRFFEELGRAHVMTVTLQGGEPFIRKDLPEIIEDIVRNRMRYEILSNGALITREIAGFLAENGRCNHVQVSIDGSSAAVHETCRGGGTFEKALSGIEYLRDQNISVSVRVTIHKFNVDDLNSIAGLLLDKIGLPGFSTNAASYLGLCRQNLPQIGLSVEDRNNAMKALLDLNRRYKGRISANAGPLAEAEMWGNMLKARATGQRNLNGRGYLTGCGGVFSKMAVLSDGTMVPCIQLSHLSLGIINVNDFKEVWRGHPTLTHLRKRRQIPLSDFSYCSGCEFLNFCTGSCPALAYNLTGETNHPSPDACLRRFLEEGGALPEEVFSA